MAKKARKKGKRSEYQKEYYIKNKAKRQAYFREYYKNNRERIKSASNARYAIQALMKNIMKLIKKKENNTLKNIIEKIKKKGKNIIESII